MHQKSSTDNVLKKSLNIFIGNQVGNVGSSKIGQLKKSYSLFF